LKKKTPAAACQAWHNAHSFSLLPRTHQPTAAAAAALAYEAAAGLTFLLLAGLWVWSRVAVKTGAASAPQALSIPALAALFALQWAAFSYLFLSACCA
jgi:hypothetical protein